MLRVLVLLGVVVATLLAQLGFAKASNKQFCYAYNPQTTEMIAEPSKGEVYAPVVEQHASVRVQHAHSWSGYCPVCSLKDLSQCAKRPCEKFNITKGGLYKRIEVKANKWIEMSDREALRSVKKGGGPFGAVIVQIDDKTHKVIRYWRNHNHVVQWNDPTAHAEVSVIRAAAKQLGVVNLGHIKRSQSKLPQPSEWSHCVIYSSTEPCPMCLAAIYWAGIKTLVFSATRYDAAVRGVGFSDKIIYNELARPAPARKYMKVYFAKTPDSLDAFNYYKRNDVKRYGAEKG